MHPALQGALVGLGIGVFLVVFEYYSLKKMVAERAAAKHQKPEFEPTERIRIRSIATFAIFLPPGLALGFWLLWG